MSENEKLIRAQQLYEKSKEIEHRIEIIENHIEKFEEFLKGIGFVDKTSEKKNSFFAPLGNGVFNNAKMGDEFFVDVGAGIIVKKTLNEIGNTIEGQVEKLTEAHRELSDNLEEMKEDFNEIVNEIGHNHNTDIKN